MAIQVILFLQNRSLVIHNKIVSFQCSFQKTPIVSFARLDHAEGASSGLMVASSEVLSEGYEHGGPGVCVGDGQTEADGVPSRGGRGDALLRSMPPIPYLT